LSQVADLAEAKEPGHAQRVAVLGLRFASELQHNAQHERADIAIAALLHDIGLSSVSYGLYQRFGGGERELLARYPSYQDALFGTEEALPGVSALLSRHCEAGSRMLQQLGYRLEVVQAVAHHHTRFDCAVGNVPLNAKLIGLADLLETGCAGLDTVAARCERAAHILDTVSDFLVEPALIDTLRRSACATETWEAAYFLDDIDATLSALVGSEELSKESVEAHLRALAEFIDAQSPYTVGHSFAVARLSRRIAEQIGLDLDIIEHIYLASLIHGAGRLSIPSAILEKRSGLATHEITLLQSYPNVTREVLAPLIGLRPLIDDACTHREKLDGSGYPEARHGESIPLIGRVLAVADTFVALTSERPYRPAYSRSRAVAIIQAESARLFDGLVTDALENVYREGF
jgi:HD-GYP domain-containing protein (c-di-GMP phosphodiesterase class II)